MSGAKRLSTFAAAVALAAACGCGARYSQAAPPAQGASGGARAKYVFLLIGDGMGVAQRASAEVFGAGERRGDALAASRLVMNSLPVQGLTTTYPAGCGVSRRAGRLPVCGDDRGSTWPSNSKPPRMPRSPNR